MVSAGYHHHSNGGLDVENRLLKKAHEFVREKHKDQKRKFTNLDYVVHLEETANILWDVNGTVEVDDLIAALLHDSVEDTDATSKEIGQLFGKVVMDLVMELTTDVEAKYAEGKAVYLTKKINNMSKRAFTIKLCDRLSNVVDLDDKKITLDFIKHYVKETNYIIKHIDREVSEVQQILIDRIKAMLLYLELTYEV